MNESDYNTLASIFILAFFGMVIIAVAMSSIESLREARAKRIEESMEHHPAGKGL